MIPLNTFVEHVKLVFNTFFPGNWSPSDFPTGTDFPPYKKSRHSVNRDMLVVMQSPDIVSTFMEVFTNDWYIGSPWLPKNGVHYMSKLVKKF